MFRLTFSLLVAAAAACTHIPAPTSSTPAPTTPAASEAPADSPRSESHTFARAEQPAELRPATVPAEQMASHAGSRSAETCYQLSRRRDFWSKTPELLCTQSLGKQAYLLTMRTGLSGDREVVRFSLRLLERVKCIDCNRDLFGIDNPSNSIFNELQIRFDGNRDLSSGREVGTVAVGSTTFFYHLAHRSR